MTAPAPAQPDAERPSRRGARAHRHIVRWSRLAQPYKSLIEFLLLLIGLAYALLFMARTWAYPAASLSIQVAERVSRPNTLDDVVVQAAFTSQSGNLDIAELKTGCKLLGDGGPCAEANCQGVGASLSSGPIPRGDGRSWGCRYRVPPGACAEISQEVIGRAYGFSAHGSRWHATTVTCKKGT